MKQITTTDFANDIARELDEIRALAADGGLRVLQDMELGWVGGGDPAPTWDGSTPPPTP